MCDIKNRKNYIHIYYNRGKKNGQVDIKQTKKTRNKEQKDNKMIFFIRKKISIHILYEKILEKNNHKQTINCYRLKRYHPNKNEELLRV